MRRETEEGRSAMHRRGFTLIELLIVVAIIAILAAIAVPNFLEAQTRAKVSRVKADQRSLATAIETYRIDWNRYPNTDTRYLEERYVPMTTPTAYITSIFFDPFGDNVLLSDGQAYPAEYHVFDFIDLKDTMNSFVISTLLPLGQMRGLPDAEHWYVASQGPDRDIGAQNNEFYFTYDPTNGSISDGDIIRTGPGGGVLE
jgi:type II secretion system protein G